MSKLTYDLRPGVKDPVVLLISRRAVLKMDIDSVIQPLRILTATREDVCGSKFPGQGIVEIDLERLEKWLMKGFDGMNELFDRHGFPEAQNVILTEGLLELMKNAGFTT